MTVLTAIAAACPVIGLEIPTQVFGSTEREHQELQALANEMKNRIVKEHDWNALKAIASISGNGVAASFTRPIDFGRFLKESQLWSSARANVPLTHVTDSDIWLSDDISGAALDNPQWTMIGTSLYIKPTLPNGEIVKYFYIKSVPAFTSDADVFAIDERLLTLGMIWQWKAQKGQPYAEDMATYEIELDQAIREDIGAGLLTIGSQKSKAHDQYTKPAEYLP